MNKLTRQKLITAGAVFVMLIICYLIFCGLIGRKKFYPNTSINGIDVGGMTADEVASAVKEQYEKEYENVHVDVALEGQIFHIMVEDALNMDVKNAVEKALNDSHHFLGRGVQFIKALFVDQQYTLIPELQDAEILHQAVKASDLNTGVANDDKGYDIVGTNLIVYKGRGGYVVDEDALVSQIEQLILTGAYNTILECPLVYGDVDLDVIYTEIFSEPVNPTLDPNNDYAMVEAVRGVSFDIEEAKRLLGGAQDGEEVQIPLIYSEPAMSTEEFQACLFRDNMGTFSTNVSGTSNRKANVELAAINCNDTILLPGEEFSFNNVVGERTTANGFKAAPSYINGESVDEVGGGICQVSSTLYNACLYANLAIKERHYHPYISSYVGAGFDATVSWGGPDYRFDNNTDFPIKVKASYSDGVVTCSIYGTKMDDYTVKLTSETIGVDEYEVVYEDDDTLEVGEEKTKVTGIPAYSIQTYRKVYDSNGELISSTEESTSHYRKRNQVVLVGTKEPEETTEVTTEEERSEEDSTTETPTTEKPETTEKPTKTEEPTTEEKETTEKPAKTEEPSADRNAENE